MSTEIKETILQRFIELNNSTRACENTGDALISLKEISDEIKYKKITLGLTAIVLFSILVVNMFLNTSSGFSKSGSTFIVVLGVSAIYRQAIRIYKLKEQHFLAELINRF